MSIKNFNVISGGGLIGNTTIDGLNAHDLSLVNYNNLVISGTTVKINNLVYPSSDGSANQVLTTDGSGNLLFTTLNTAPVTSVNAKIGVVVLNTDDISEGSTNLYYTNTRVDNRISAASIKDLSDVSYSSVSSNNFLRWDGSNWTASNLGGTNNYIVKYSSATNITNSIIYDSGTNVGISTASPSQKLHVTGGNIALFDSSDRIIYVGTDVSNSLAISYDSTNKKSTLTSNNSSNPVMELLVGSNRGIYIDKDGNIESGGKIYSNSTIIGFNSTGGGQNDLIILKDSTINKNDISISTKGTLVIGSGDSASSYYDTNSNTIKNTKTLYITSNNTIKFISNLSNSGKTIEFNTSGQIISNVTTGTSPFSITSTTLVSNLNADYLDGKHANEFLQTNSEGTAAQTITFNDGLRTGFINFNQYDNYDPDDVANTGGGAGIVNDSNTYKALMILGNKSNDNSTRIVKVYDNLNVNHATTIGTTLTVNETSTLTGNVSMAGTLSVSGATTFDSNVTLNSIKPSSTKMVTINTNGVLTTDEIPTIRKELANLTPIGFPFIDGTYTVNVTTSVFDSNNVNIHVDIVPDNGSYTVYFGYDEGAYKKRTISWTISQTQIIADTPNKFSLMYVEINNSTSYGSGIETYYTADDLGKNKIRLATIKLRNAYNSKGEVIEIINWSKLVLNEGATVTHWETSTSGNGNSGDMVISNGSNQLITTNNINWSNSDKALSITGESKMLRLKYLTNKAGTIIGYNGTDEHWFLGRGDSSLSDVHFGTINESKLQLRTNGSNRLTIDTSGNIGIGTTNPDHMLTLYKGDIIIKHEGAGTESILFNHYFSSWHKYYTSEIKFDWYGHTYNNVQLNGMLYKSGREAFANHYFLDDLESVQLVITDDKKVGIDIVSPSEKLHVASGNAKVEGTVQARDYVEVVDDTGAEGFKMQWNDTDKSIDFIIN